MNLFTNIKKKFKIYFSYKNYKKKGNFFIKTKIEKVTIRNFLYSIPFFFSFIEIIYFYYKKKNFFYFFQNNFSIKKKLEEKILWETFDFFKIKEFSFFENKQNIKQYNVYNDYFFLEVSKKNLLTSIGIIKKNFVKNFKEEKIFNNSKFLIRADNLIFFSDLKKIFFFKKLINFSFFEKFFYTIDFIPTKINEIENFSKKNNCFFYLKKKQIKNSLNLKIKKNEFNFFNFNYIKKEKFLIFNKNQKNFKSLKYKGIKEKIFFQVGSKSEKKTFFHKKKIFQKKINLFFYKKNFFFVNAKLKNFNFMKKIFLTVSKNEIVFILENFLKKKKIEYIYPRFISGYSFVELKKIKTDIIFFNSLYKNKEYKIIFPFDFLFFLNQNLFLFTKNFSFFVFSEKKSNFFGFNLAIFNEIENKTNVFETFNKKIYYRKIKKNIYKKYKKINDFSIKNFLFFFDIKKKQELLFFEENKILLKKNSFFNFFVNKKEKNKITSEIQPILQNLFYENYQSSKYYFLYKLNFFSLKKKNETENLYFSENWESFSLISWLFITQFIISSFLLKIIKNVYQDYGKELIQFLIEFGNLTEIDLDGLKEQYLVENSEYRIIEKTKKQFKDIVGIDFILSECGEILWLLKNFGRSAKYKKIIPKGVLLTGPPGTGKTLLVQAIVGESKIPVIVQSATLFIDPKQKGKSAKKLKKIFQKARIFSPCIIFIDEIDSIGSKRQKFFQLGNNGDKIFESMYQKTNLILDKNITNINFLGKKPQTVEDSIQLSKNLNNEETFFSDFSKNIDEQKTKLSLLTQFLIEMDGLKNRKGVFVFGATNRLESLDPALIRPGRFDKIITLPAPSKNKKIQILKFYSKKRKIEKKISWNYLANRMIHCSAADIAAIMNESAIQSIIQNTTHTVETIEKGIDYITSYNILKNKKINLLKNKSYFQSGKALSYILFSKKNEKGIFLRLWDRKNNTRSEKTFYSYFCQQQTRKNLEFFLISLHFAKVGEFLFLFGKKNKKLKFFQSDYGHEERLVISFLTNFLLENWFFYSTKISIRQKNQTKSNFSLLEKKEYNFILTKIFENEIELNKKNKISNIDTYQKRNISTWWRQEISKKVAETEVSFSDWYRLFLPDPEESLLNLEWIPPDLIINNNKILKKLGIKSIINYNNLYKIQRDFIFQSLILNTFDFAFCKEECLRQFLDFTADQLLRYGVVRDIEIKRIFKLYKK